MVCGALGSSRCKCGYVSEPWPMGAAVVSFTTGSYYPRHTCVWQQIRQQLGGIRTQMKGRILKAKKCVQFTPARLLSVSVCNGW